MNIIVYNEDWDNFVETQELLEDVRVAESELDRGEYFLSHMKWSLALPPSDQVDSFDAILARSTFTSWHNLQRLAQHKRRLCRPPLREAETQGFKPFCIGMWTTVKIGEPPTRRRTLCFAREGDAVSGEEPDASLDAKGHAKRVDLCRRKLSLAN